MAKMTYRLAAFFIITLLLVLVILGSVMDFSMIFSSDTGGEYNVRECPPHVCMLYVCVHYAYA